MFKLFGLVLLCSGWGLSAACLHVVRTPAGVSILPKDRLSFTDTYADTRTWTPEDLPKHSALVARLVASDRGQLLAHVVEPQRHADLNERLIKAAHVTEKGEAPQANGGRSIFAGIDLAWEQ
jgi:hypothetical protein